MLNGMEAVSSLWCLACSVVCGVVVGVRWLVMGIASWEGLCGVLWLLCGELRCGMDVRVSTKSRG